MKPDHESFKRTVALTLVGAVALILGLSFVGYVGERIVHIARPFDKGLVEDRLSGLGYRFVVTLGLFVGGLGFSIWGGQNLYRKRHFIGAALIGGGGLSCVLSLVLWRFW